MQPSAHSFEKEGRRQAEPRKRSSRNRAIDRHSKPTLPDELRAIVKRLGRWPRQAQQVALQRLQLIEARYVHGRTNEDDEVRFVPEPTRPRD